MTASPVLPSWADVLAARWPDTEWRLMFHGTAHAFDNFSEASVGRGSDANSALGVHLAEWPGAAAEYADASVSGDSEAAAPRVLVVALPAYSPTNELDDFFKFFGEPDDGIPGVMEALPARDHEHFRQERQRLLAAGHDVVDYEDGEQVISVALDPSPLVIVGRLSVEAARSIEEAMSRLPDAFDARARLALLEKMGSGWSPSALPAIPRPRRGVAPR